MNDGLRIYKGASCMVGFPQVLPAEYRGAMREISALVSAKRGRGHASVLLHNLCVEADEHGMYLLVLVRPFAQGMGEVDLINFYARHGFELLQWAPAILMMRKPKAVLH